MCFLLSKPVYNGGIHDIRVLHDLLPLFFFFLGFGLLRFKEKSLFPSFHLFHSNFPFINFFFYCVPHFGLHLIIIYYVVSDLTLIIHHIAIHFCTLSFSIYNHVRTNCYIWQAFSSTTSSYRYIYVYIF